MYDIAEIWKIFLKNSSADQKATAAAGSAEIRSRANATRFLNSGMG